MSKAMLFLILSFLGLIVSEICFGLFHKKNAILKMVLFSCVLIFAILVQAGLFMEFHSLFDVKAPGKANALAISFGIFLSAICFAPFAKKINDPCVWVCLTLLLIAGATFLGYAIATSYAIMEYDYANKSSALSSLMAWIA